MCRYPDVSFCLFVILALVLKQPIRICIPIFGDQAFNAMYIADTHGLGYELYNVRNWLGARPLHRKGDWAPPCTVDAVKEEFEGVLKSALSEDGEQKRRNVERMRAKIEESWKPGGGGWKELDKFFNVMQ